MSDETSVEMSVGSDAGSRELKACFPLPALCSLRVGESMFRVWLAASPSVECAELRLC